MSDLWELDKLDFRLAFADKPKQWTQTLASIVNALDIMNNTDQHWWINKGLFITYTTELNPNIKDTPTDVPGIKTWHSVFHYSFVYS